VAVRHPRKDADFAETVGASHEIEHVIEQLDDVDLAAQARLPDTGVHSVSADSHVYETARALRVGLKVTEEVQAFRR